MDLWEILVPTVWEGKELSYHHRVWDEHVRSIAGGLTILKPTTKGYWTSGNEVHEESMIPVRIACTKEKIEDIAVFTKKHYNQLAIMYYKLSDEIYFV